MSTYIYAHRNGYSRTVVGRTCAPISVKLPELGLNEGWVGGKEEEERLRRGCTTGAVSAAINFSLNRFNPRKWRGRTVWLNYPKAARSRNLAASIFVIVLSRFKRLLGERVCRKSMIDASREFRNRKTIRVLSARTTTFHINNDLDGNLVNVLIEFKMEGKTH